MVSFVEIYMECTGIQCQHDIPTCDIKRECVRIGCKQFERFSAVIGIFSNDA
jgi:hypothetical protein